MVLAKQTQEIPLNGGLDAKQSAQLQDPGTLTEASNLRFNQLHQLEKRSWYTQAAALFDGTTYSDSANIESTFAHRGYPCGLTENEGVGYVAGTAAESANGEFGDSGGIAGHSRACRVSREIIGATQFGALSLGLIATTCSVIESPEVTVVAWLELNTASTMTMHAIARNADGACIAKTSVGGLTYTFSLIASPSMQSCVTGNSVPEALITYAVDAGGSFSVFGVTYNANTATFSTPVALATSLQYPNHHVLGGPSASAASYLAAVDSGSSFLKVWTLNGSLAVAATHTSTHGAGVGVSMSRSATTGNVLITSCSASTAWAERLGTPGSVVTIHAATASETLVGVASGNQTILSDSDRHMILVGVRDTELSVVFTALTRTFDYSYATNAVIAQDIEANVLPLTHGVTLGSRAYFAVHLGIGVLEGHLTSAMVVRADGERLARVARVCHDRLMATPVYTAQVIHSFGSVGTSRITGAFLGDVSPIKPAAITNLFGLGQSVLLPTVEFAADGEAFPLVSVEHDGTTIVASGDLGDWDGKALNEAQPLYRPRCRGVALGSGATTGLYRFAAVWRFVDQAGKLHRSQPSPIASESMLTTSAQIDVYVTKPPLTTLQGDGAMQVCDVELYVSEVGGSILYMATTATGEKHVPQVFPHYAKFSSIQPGLTTSPTIYTNGTTPLPSNPPPSFLSIAKISDVVWGIDAEDRRRIWHSKPLVAGYAPEWASTNTHFIADEAVGISDLNGTPTIFSNGGIWVVEGAGPNANGVGGFAPARRLPVEVSAVCPTSICKVPGGVFFRSTRGMALLDNSFSVQPIGLPIDPLMPLTRGKRSVIRTVYDERHNEVRVIDQEAGCFVFNLVEGKWTQFRQDVEFQYIADACVAGGRVWYAAATETVWEMRRELGVDEDSHNESREVWSLATPWLKVDGVAGFGRLWRAYPVLEQSPNTLSTVTLVSLLDFDWGEGDSQVNTWGSVADLSGAGETFTVAIHPRKQAIKCFRLALAESGTLAHAGSKPVALRLEMGVRPGSKQRVPDAARKG